MLKRISSLPVREWSRSSSSFVQKNRYFSVGVQPLTPVEEASKLLSLRFNVHHISDDRRERLQLSTLVHALRSFSSTSTMEADRLGLSLKFYLNHLKGKELKKNKRTRPVVARECFLPTPPGSLCHFTLVCSGPLREHLGVQPSEKIQIEELSYWKDLFEKKIKVNKKSTIIVPISESHHLSSHVGLDKILKSRFPTARNGGIMEDSLIKKRLEELPLITQLKCTPD
eukprot:Sdes_comp22187_c0_seq1m20694